MTVQFDNTLGVWLVVRSDGTIVMSGFPTNAAAWKWIDANSDQGMAATADRIRDAFSARPIVPQLKPKPKRLSRLERRAMKRAKRKAKMRASQGKVA